MKKKMLAVVAMVSVAMMALFGCGSKESKELNLYTWDGMFPQEVLDGFEEESGYKINYNSFVYDEDMLAKLEETEGGDYDYVIADDYILEMIIKEGLAQKLDSSRLNQLKNINPLYQGQFYDPKDEYTIPYGAGIPLIVYDPSKVEIEIDGYEDLWDESLKGEVALIGSYRVVEGIALKTLGYSFNTENLDEIEKAGEKLLELAPNVRLIQDENTQDQLLNGEASVGFLYTSQVVAALQANPDLKVVYPKEGLGFGIMAGFIPSQAPNQEAAYAFADYINQPEVAAKCFEYIGYYCTNQAAEEEMSEEMKQVLILPEGTQKGELIRNVSKEAEDLHAKNWEKFRMACE